MFYHRFTTFQRDIKEKPLSHGRGFDVAENTAELYTADPVWMRKYDFKDLMAFGMFILALLTFTILISQ